jgi:hypothetical protein
MFHALARILRTLAATFVGSFRSGKPASSGMQIVATGTAEGAPISSVEVGASGQATQEQGAAYKRSPDSSRRYAQLNPHLVVAPLRSGTAEELADELGLYTNQEGFTACIERIRQSYERASRILMANADVAARFPDGVPLAYALYPKLEPLTADELGAMKFGGLPDIRHFHWLNNISDKGQGQVKADPSFDDRLLALARHWPTCACCHRPMKFIGQMDLTDWALAIHALTSEVHEGQDADSWRSGLGLTRTFGGARRGWWYFFACSDASTHFDNPSMDCHVWIERRYVPFKINRPGYQVNEERGLDEETARKLVEAFYEGIPARENDEDDHEQGAWPLCEPQKIVGFDIGWELDPAVGGWSLSDTMRELMEENEEVFGKGNAFTLFGSPRSQQVERRYWTVSGNGRGMGPQRMAPLLHFDDKVHDVTYQLYADMLGDFYGCNIYGKIDASCT